MQVFIAPTLMDLPKMALLWGLLERVFSDASDP